MKAALLALAFGAFVTSRAADSEDGAPEQENPAQALFDDAASIDWDRFSPGALGMKLNFDELSAEELEKVVDGFIQLGLIGEHERELFRASLTNPVMRKMLTEVQENWGNTMVKILKDPMFTAFLQKLKGGVDDMALGQIVGFENGIGEAVKRLQEDQEDQQDEAEEGEEEEEEGEEEEEEAEEKDE